MSNYLTLVQVSYNDYKLVIGGGHMNSLISLEKLIIKSLINIFYMMLIGRFQLGLILH